MIVRSGVFTPFSQLQVWVRRPPTHGIKANRHHYRPKDTYGPTWSNLGSSYVKLTFGHSTHGALRAAAGWSSRNFPAVKVIYTFTIQDNPSMYEHQHLEIRPLAPLD